MLSSAKAVLEQKDDQTKVDNAVASLNKAIEGLKKKEAVKPAVIDTKALESAIEKADTLKEADYTADSWKTFSEMLASAKAVLEQKDDQTKVNNAAESLNKAIEGLKKKEAVKPGAGTNTTVATGNKSNSTTTNTTGSTAKNTTVKKASKTGDTNPLMGMLALAFASISLVGAALFAKKPNRK